MQNPPHLVSEDASSGDPITNHLHNISDQDFKEEILKIFKELKEIRKCTAHKTTEDIRIELRKFQTEIS